MAKSSKGASSKPKELSKKATKELAQTKIVVRRLPPALTEEEFFEQLGYELPYDYFYFSSSDPSLGAFAFCRAYINLKGADDALKLRDAADGLMFRDSKGSEYPAVVEFSPCQKLPHKTRRRPDPKLGTIEKDPDYLAFLKSLEPEETTPVTETPAEQEEARQKELEAQLVQQKNTPLIEFMRQKRAARSSSQRSASAGVLSSGKGGKSLSVLEKPSSAKSSSAKSSSAKSSSAKSSRSHKDRKGDVAASSSSSQRPSSAQKSSSSKSGKESSAGKSKRLDDGGEASKSSSKPSSKTSSSSKASSRTSSKDHGGREEGGRQRGNGDDSRDRRQSSSRGYHGYKEKSGQPDSYEEVAPATKSTRLESDRPSSASRHDRTPSSSRHDRDRPTSGRSSQHASDGWGDDREGKSSAKPEREPRRQRRPAQQIYTPRGRQERGGESGAKRDA